MNKDFFIKRKETLESLIRGYLTNENVRLQDKTSLEKLLDILNQYSFENRLQKKGLLSHTIIDSLELDYSLAEELIKFDSIIK